VTKTTKAECQFCAGVEPFESPAGAYSPADFTELAPMSSKKPLRRMTGAWRWKDYTIELLGHVYNTVPPEPPIFYRKWLAWFQRIEQHDAEGRSLHRWTLFNGYHITHKNGWSMDAHWWDSHDLIFTVKGFNSERDFDSLTQFLKLFKPETRGHPKINNVEVVKALQKVGTDATQSAVAKELGVTARTLRRWSSRHGLEDWQRVKQYYGKTQIW
jgi:hypothetical protein